MDAMSKRELADRVKAMDEEEIATLVKVIPAQAMLDELTQRYKHMVDITSDMALVLMGDKECVDGFCQ